MCANNPRLFCRSVAGTSLRRASVSGHDSLAAKFGDANRLLRLHIDRPHVLRTLVFYRESFRPLREKTLAMSHWRPNIQQLRDDRERLTREHYQVEHWTSFSSTPFPVTAGQFRLTISQATHQK